MAVQHSEAPCTLAMKTAIPKPVPKPSSYSFRLSADARHEGAGNQVLVKLENWEAVAAASYLASKSADTKAKLGSRAMALADAGLTPEMVETWHLASPV